VLAGSWHSADDCRTSIVSAESLPFRWPLVAVRAPDAPGAPTTVVLTSPYGVLVRSGDRGSPGPRPRAVRVSQRSSPLERPTPSRPLSESGTHDYAPGNAGPSTFNGLRIASSLKASWMIAISLELDHWPGINESSPVASPRKRLPSP